MPDLLQSAKLFEVSTRLQSASSSLGKFAQGLELNDKERDIFKWAGTFLTKVDWTSEIPTETGMHSGLTVSATNARPKFYASLLKIGPKLQKLGIDSEKEVRAFLGTVYKLLMSGGTETANISRDQLELVGELLHILSLNIMVDLSNNMLPKRRTLLTVGERF